MRYLIGLIILLFMSCGENKEDLSGPTNQINGEQVFQSRCISCHGEGGTFPELATSAQRALHQNAMIASVEDGSMPHDGPLEDAEKEALLEWIKSIQATEVSSTVENSSSGATSSSATSASSSMVVSSSETQASSESFSSSNVQIESSSSVGSEPNAPSSSVAIVSSSSSAPEPAATLYKDVQPIMETYCYSCHGALGRSPRLHTYELVKTNINTVISEVESGSMPKGTTKVSAPEIQTLKDWLNQGLKE